MGGALSCVGSCSCEKGDFKMSSEYDIKIGKAAEIENIDDEIDMDDEDE